MLARSDSPGVLPCVWMSAGLISFKLCDRAGECEGCPFDRVMRRLAVDPEPGPGADPGGPAPAPWAFPADRGYHRGHGWARPAGPGRLRLGVDALVARLWDRPSGVVLPALGSRLAAGETACWLQDGPELLAIPAAAGGTVVARNGAVLADPALVAASPYDAGWLFEVEGEATGAPLLPAEEAGAAAAAAYRGFQAAAGRALGRAAPGRTGLGPTLPDGGEPLADLRSMLGPPRHAALARRYLSLRVGRRAPSGL